MLLFYLLISAMPLTRDPLWEHFVSDLTAIKFLGLGCLAYAFWHCMVARRAPALGRAPEARMMLALCAWAALSWLTLGAPIAWEQSPLLSYLSFFLLLLITLCVVDSWPRLEQVLWAAVAAVAVASLYILREWQEYHNVYANFRPGWVTGDPNYFTASALIGLPLALAFCSARLAWWKRLAAAGCVLLTLLAIALAASRGGMLGLGAMSLVFAWRKRCLALLLLACLAAVPPLLLWRSSPLNRLLHPSVSDTESSDSRLALWHAGLAMIAVHPLTGIGLGEFKPEVERYAAQHQDLDHIAHNSYLELAAEMGLPALAAFLLILALCQRTLAQLRTAAASALPTPGAETGEADQREARGAAPQEVAVPPWAADAALGLQTGILGFAVSAFFLSAQYTKLFWLAVALSAAIRGLLAQEAQVPESIVLRRAAALPTGAVAHG